MPNFGLLQSIRSCTARERVDLTDAVRSTESNALLLRNALVHEIDFVPDEYAEHNDLVAQDMRQIDIEGDKTVWNEVMPEKGVQPCCAIRPNDVRAVPDDVRAVLRDEETIKIAHWLHIG